MSDDNTPRRITDVPVLGPERNLDLRMPAETPLGLGILGAAKFAAIRRVIEHRERALRAIGAMVEAEASVGDAIVRRETVREQLRNIDTICSDERNRIVFGHDMRKMQHEAQLELMEIEKIQRQLRKLELEEQLAQARSRTQQPTAQAEPAPLPAAPPPADPMDEAARTIQAIPGLGEVLRRAKDDIHRAAGGDAGESETQLLAFCDMVAAISINQKAAGALL